MTQLRDAFITAAGAFLPGPPIANDAIEDHIGRVGGRDSLFGRRALRWNGVQTRHYALDASGQATGSNAGMCAAAVSAALDAAGLERSDLTFLAAATTQGDLLVPGHAAAVHGELGGPPLEIASFQSVCGSSLMAAKSAWLQVRAGEHKVAAACAGEFSSRWFRPAFYEGTALVDAKGRLNAEADFLRFTLSDGAGAVILEPTPRPDAISLKVEYIDLVSRAGSFESCMWAGAREDERSDLTAAWSHAGPVAAHAAGAVALLQDFELLKRVIRAWVGEYLKAVLVSLLEQTAGMIPLEKWFSNLPTVGNIGSASIWVMLEAFLKSGRLKRGQKVLCVVPESGRAFVGFMMLEAV